MYVNRSILKKSRHIGIGLLQCNLSLRSMVYHKGLAQFSWALKKKDILLQLCHTNRPSFKEILRNKIILPWAWAEVLPTDPFFQILNTHSRQNPTLGALSVSILCIYGNGQRTKGSFLLPNRLFCDTQRR
jgi:hypothetical protein